VFGNLLNNASKFSDPGTVISLQVDAPTTENEARSVTVRVCDTGVGIDTAVLPHVFDLFVQEDRSLDRRHGGLGIGLTLVQRLVELHGGTVEAHSEGPQRGSEFIVRLPVLFDPTPEEPASLRSDPPKSIRSSLRRRVLVVDDHEDSVTMMAVLLRSKGYDVATARSGAAALETANTFRPEIVVLDIGLPEIDGYEVARRLRKVPAIADTFIS